MGIRMDIGGSSLAKDGRTRSLALTTLTAVLLATIVLQPSLAYVAGDPEYRAFYVDAWHAGALSQAQVDNLLGVVGNPTSTGQIRQAKCNTVFIQVRRNADTMYPSAVGEPYMSGLTPSDFNGLQAVINAAHDTTGGKQRIDVHAWIATFRTGGGSVYADHDDPPTGSLTELDNYWIGRDSSGVEVSDKPFDPGHPRAEQYVTDVCMDLVNNYDIDGLHFDYIRFSADNHGYNPTSVARYNARYGTTGEPQPLDEQFQQWRRDQVTALVRKVYAQIQASKPSVKLSASLFSGSPCPASSTRAGFEGTRPFYEVYSDWDSWLQEGIVDMAVPMTYFDYASLPGEFNGWLNFEKDRHGDRHMIIAPGLYLNSLANSVVELQKTREPSEIGNCAHGFCGFSYYLPYINGTWTGFKSSFISGLTSGGPAPIPAMPWKTSPTKGHISGTVTYASSGAWADGALVSIVGPETRSQLCDGTGFYAFIDLSPGAYTMTVSSPGLPNQVRSITVELGEVTGNMYVNNVVLTLEVPPPTIINVATPVTSATTADISWTTDQASTSQVEYGSTANYGSITELDSSNVTSHTVTLTGLTPETTYHYRVRSTNENGSAYSADYTFVSAGTLTISGVEATNIGGGSATITWNTSQAGSSRVEYGLTEQYGDSTTTDTAEVTAHSVVLTGLSPNTTYHYRVISGNVNGTVPSADQIFATSGLPLISNIQAGSITDSGATITWVTDMESTSQVDYGPTTEYASSTPLDSQPVSVHSVVLSGLTPKSVYNFRVKSTTAGGTSTSANYTFATDGSPSISGVQATGITPDSATITWTTDTYSGSQVNYGPTVSYGSQGANAGLVVTHSTRLTGLTPGTEYHYQCVSDNAYGTAVSEDCTFTTPEIIAEIVVDNNDSGWQNTSPNDNTWTAGSYAGVGRIGDNYLYYRGDGSTTESSVTRKCTWTPALPVDGIYDVYAYYQIGTNRSASAPFTVYHMDASATYTKNQYGNSTLTGWYLLGANLPFRAGTEGYVQVTTLSTDGVGYVSADAVKWVYKGPLDLIAPEISLSAPSKSLTSHGPVTYTVYYNGADTVSLAAANITLNKTGTANATLTVSGTGTSVRTVTLSSITGSGTLGISVAAATASDAAGNTAPAAGPSVTFQVDNEAPAMALSSPSHTATTSGPIDYTVTYTGADSVALDVSKITLAKTGTANGAVAVIGSGTSTRIVRVSGITGSGTLGISIVAGTGTDAAGNTTPASGASATFAVDNTAPTVSISQPTATSATAGPVSYTVTYVGATEITLSPQQVVLNATGNAGATVSVTGSGTTTRTVTLSPITGSGALRISIAAGTATDAAGNAAAHAGPSASINVDNSPPEMDVVNTDKYTTSTSSLKAYWSAYDPESAIIRYEYAVGTTPLGIDVKYWTSARNALYKSISARMYAGRTYYVSIRAVNSRNLVSAPMSSGPIRIAKSVSSIGAAKLLPNGTAVSLPSRVVTLVLPTAFYIQESNRSAGIRVIFPGTLTVNKTIKVMGVIGIADNGERAILDPVLPSAPGRGTPVRPITISTSGVGGATQGYTPGVTGGTGSNNTGLVVKVRGLVTAVVDDGFYLDDGAALNDGSGNVGLKIWTGASGSAVAGSTVSVTGVVSLRKSGDMLYGQILAPLPGSVIVGYPGKAH